MVIFRFFFFPLCRWKKKLTYEKEYIDLRQNTVLFFFKKTKKQIGPISQPKWQNLWAIFDTSKHG